ncbi:hypothetical protein MKW92_018831 [Papaver armeniacum]|nr:hypothetical protein MKW92_018831 [Papaver armeniacum]
MASEISQQHQLHVFIFPVTAQGHMIPMINIAKLFASRGVKATIISTPLNAITLSKTIDQDRLSGLDINIQTIPFPAVEVGLPEGMESVNQITSPDMMPKFFLAMSMLQGPFEKLLEKYHPDFIVADMFLPWTTEAAAKFGIPRLIFHGTNIFSHCVAASLKSLPDKIEMTISQVPEYIIGSDSVYSKVLEKVRESEQKSYGVLANSFYELESAYADHYKNVLGIRAWQIGPLSLRNNDTLENAQRRNTLSIEEHSILDWLDSKQQNSVIYVSFGSMSKLSSAQLTEIATGLEDSRCSFIWVVRKITAGEENFLPEGFEERIQGKGLIIREWAPQVLILDHPAVGGFMTHCGWNSILEGISAGVPMVTWPMFAEQFYNEIFVTEVLKIGSKVGAEEWNDWVQTTDVSVKMEKISKALTQLMTDDGDENKEMRRRVAELSEKAKSAVREDGSSYVQFTALIEELKLYNKILLSPKMGSEAPPPPQQLHGFFFPLMAYGHMIPMFDVARMFAARGVKATIITTPINASTFSKKAERDRLSGLDINIQILRFPTEEAGLPEGCENVNDIDGPEMIPNFFNAINMLQEPLEKLFEEFHPDFIVADMFLYWATESAGKFGIPRFVFHGTNIFCQCVEHSLNLYKPDQGIASDTEAFVVPGLPDKIEMTRLQVPDHLKLDSPFSEMLVKIRESEIKSYGVLVNSFYELEPAYADYYRNVMGRRAWQIGPVSLLNRNTVDKAQRGKQSAVDEHYVLNWLDSKEPNSVLYICFGTSRMNNAQLLEIAMALEDSSVSFVWVIRTTGSNKDERFLPEGYEEKNGRKGMIIREWAPQVLILDHPSVGGFMTHCGWNSTLEGVSAGVPMITWPLFAEQFHNEKLVTQVLKTGIPAGAGKWQQWLETKEVSVHKEKIEEAIQLLMGDGKEAKEMRRKAKELGEMARKAVEDGGSSYTEFTSLIEELKISKKAST